MKRITYMASCLLLFLSISNITSAQVTLTGPTCVVPGTVYQYSINGTWDSTSTMQVCITGGVLADTANTNTCTVAAGVPLAKLLVIWDTASINALITITSSSGNNTLQVSTISALQPGAIDSTVKYQIAQYDSLPLTITCSADNGGSCAPAYADQWQQSPDAVNWTDISGSTGGNLNFTAPVTTTTYYRRRVTETSSLTIGYSDIAAVFIGVTVIAADSANSQPDSTQAGSGFSNHSQRVGLPNNTLQNTRESDNLFYLFTFIDADRKVNRQYLVPCNLGLKYN